MGILWLTRNRVVIATPAFISAPEEGTSDAEGLGSLHPGWFVGGLAE